MRYTEVDAEPEGQKTLNVQRPTLNGGKADRSAFAALAGRDPKSNFQHPENIQFIRLNSFGPSSIMTGGMKDCMNVEGFTHDGEKDPVWKAIREHATHLSVAVNNAK